MDKTKFILEKNEIKCNISYNAVKILQRNAQKNILKTRLNFIKNKRHIDDIRETARAKNSSVIGFRKNKFMCIK